MAKILIHCVECGHELAAPFTDHRLEPRILFAEHEWIMSVVDVRDPTLAPVCKDCAAKIYSPEVLERAKQSLAVAPTDFYPSLPDFDVTANRTVVKLEPYRGQQHKGGRAISPCERFPFGVCHDKTCWCRPQLVEGKRVVVMCTICGNTSEASGCPHHSAEFR